MVQPMNDWNEYIEGPARLFAADVREFSQGLVLDTAAGLIHFPGQVTWRVLGATDSFEDLDPSLVKFYQNNFAQPMALGNSLWIGTPLATLNTIGTTELRTLEVAQVLAAGLVYQSGISSALYGVSRESLGQPAPSSPRGWGQLVGGNLVMVGGMRLTPAKVARGLNAVEDIVTMAVEKTARRQQKQPILSQMGIAGDVIGALRDKATLLMRRRQFQQAAEAYSELAGLETEKNGAPSPITLTNLGIAFRETSQLAKAKQALEWAIHIKEHPRTWCELAITLRRMKTYDESLTALDQAIKLDATPGRSFCERGITLREMGRLHDARETLEHTLTLNEQQGLLYPAANVVLAEVLAALADVDGAAVVLHKLKSGLESVGLRYSKANFLLTVLQKELPADILSPTARTIKKEIGDLSAILRGLAAKHAKKLGNIYRHRITGPNERR